MLAIRWLGRRVSGMKLNTAVAKSLLMVASIVMIGSLAAQTAPKIVKPAPAPVVPAPAEEPAVIEGLEIARQGGGYLGITVDGVRLVMKFYDAEKKPAPVNVARASARWDPVNKTGEVRSVLNAGPDGQSLVSTPVLKPPFVFKVYLTLLDADGNAVESAVADLRLLNAPKTE